MREQIYELIDSYAGMWNADKTSLASKMESLMCYREVRAIVKAMEGAIMTPEDIRILCIEVMIYDYPESIITAAIERVKSESK